MKNKWMIYNWGVYLEGLKEDPDRNHKDAI